MHTNRLINATSPYLLQHAHNPVDWYEWGDEALQRAIKEDKPILISIGYSACHWCHVMERECFEQADIAAIMNEFFVCIKVDREERPDIDHLYMEAVQAMNINGGWPLNVFLTPDQKPFYGGTYFPPTNWAKMLNQLNAAFRQRRDEINQSAEDLKNHLQQSDINRFANNANQELFAPASLEQMVGILEKKYDRIHGGIDKAPKFVMPSVWLFLLRCYDTTRQQEALDMVMFTLKKIAQGGIYDQLGGGFARYSVDGEWFAPHFEKMLYDNAQLLSLFSEAYRYTHDDLLKSVVEETVAWLNREMSNSHGGLYSALDADSEGVEGKFYTWTHQEMASHVSEETISFFACTPEGNWEDGRNILTQANERKPSDIVGLDKRTLLNIRSLRIRPSLDDKILTGWNAMAISGLVDAYKSFATEHYLASAIKTMSFIETYLIAGDKVFRSYKGKRSHTEGFLEDYAFLIQAYRHLYEVTFNEHWLQRAIHWLDYTLVNFFDTTDGYFHFNSNSAEQLIARKKEVFDNVIPGSNSVMARNLFYLATITDNTSWHEIAVNMVARLNDLITQEPVYLSNWGILKAELTERFAEIAIVGPQAEELRKELHQQPLTKAIVVGTLKASNLPLLQNRESKNGETWIYVCYQKTCQLPVKTIAEARSLLQ